MDRVIPIYFSIKRWTQYADWRVFKGHNFLQFCPWMWGIWAFAFLVCLFVCLFVFFTFLWLFVCLFDFYLSLPHTVIFSWMNFGNWGLRGFCGRHSKYLDTSQGGTCVGCVFLPVQYTNNCATGSHHLSPFWQLFRGCKKMNFFWHASFGCLARHSERGKRIRQTEEEVGRQHQGIDRPGVRQRAVENRKTGGNWLQNHLWCPNDPRG